MKTIYLVAIIVVGIIGMIMIGLNVSPKPLPSSGFTAGTVETVPLPAGLPAPVARYLLTVYGEEIPLIETAILSGRAKLTVNGITFPSRYRFTHNAGQDYRHYIEATFFGLPLLKVNEKYVNGHSLFAMPFGTLEDDPNTNQGANLALWAEAVWFPAIWATDETVEWQAVDEVSAILYVPFDDEMESILLRFDPDTGLLSYLESMRFKGEMDQEKSLWINKVQHWDEVNGFLIPDAAEVMWYQDGEPWAVFETEELILNAEIGEYIDAVGP